MTLEVQHTDVAAYALGLLEEDDRKAFEGLVAPVRVLLLAREHQRHVEGVTVAELARVGDDDPDPAAELEVVDEEGDLHSGLSTACPSTW